MLTNKFCFFKRLFIVKLVYSIQVLGPWLWGNSPFFFFNGGAEEGAQWGKCPPLHGIKTCLACSLMWHASLKGLYSTLIDV